MPSLPGDAETRGDEGAETLPGRQGAGAGGGLSIAVTCSSGARIGPSSASRSSVRSPIAASSALVRPCSSTCSPAQPRRGSSSAAAAARHRLGSSRNSGADRARPEPRRISSPPRSELWQGIAVDRPAYPTKCPHSAPGIGTGGDRCRASGQADDAGTAGAAAARHPHQGAQRGVERAHPEHLIYDLLRHAGCTEHWQAFTAYRIVPTPHSGNTRVTGCAPASTGRERSRNAWPADRAWQPGTNCRMRGRGGGVPRVRGLSRLPACAAVLLGRPGSFRSRQTRNRKTGGIGARVRGYGDRAGLRSQARRRDYRPRLCRSCAALAARGT